MGVDRNPVDPIRVRNAVRRIVGKTSEYSTTKYSGSLRTLTAPATGTTAGNATAIEEISDVLATLIEDLQDKGIVSE